MSTSAPIQSITITRTENRRLPSPHVVYAILVVLPVRSWTVYRRYSEFSTLHQTLLEAGSPLPAPLPPKHAARRTIDAITGMGGLLPRSETAREADEAHARDRKEGLELYMRAILASTDGSWRKTDAFRDFIELPKGHTLASLGGVSSPASPSASRYVPGSYAGPSNGNQASRADQAALGNVTTRTLGVKAPIKETEATRRLDERGLIASQQAQMDAQDSQLGDLAAVLRRQKAMGLAINHELLEQSELLENLDQEVGQTQGKMKGAEGQMKKLGG